MRGVPWLGRLVTDRRPGRDCCTAACARRCSVARYGGWSSCSRRTGRPWGSPAGNRGDHLPAADQGAVARPAAGVLCLRPACGPHAPSVPDGTPGASADRAAGRRRRRRPPSELDWTVSWTRARCGCITVRPRRGRPGASQHGQAPDVRPAGAEYVLSPTAGDRPKVADRVRPVVGRTSTR